MWNIKGDGKSKQTCLRKGVKDLLSKDPRKKREGANILEHLLKLDHSSMTKTSSTKKQSENIGKRKRILSTEGSSSSNAEQSQQSESDDFEGNESGASFRAQTHSRRGSEKSPTSQSNAPSVIQDQDDDTRPKDHAGVNKVYKVSKSKLPDDEVYRILTKADNGELNKFLMHKAPVKPKGGEIFLCVSKGPKDFSYRVDEYFGFKGRGDSKGNETSPLFRWYLKYLNEEGVVVPGFEKEEYCLRERVTSDERIILVHYIGSEAIWKARPHGNSRSGKIFTPNTKQVKEKVKRKLADTGRAAKHVYQIEINEAAKEDEVREATRGPRDKKQVENIKYQLDKEKRILRDELFSVYEMIRSQRLGGFIKLFMVPDEAFVLAEPEALNLAAYLLEEAKDKSKQLPQALTYDTTFSVMDGYVSPLVMRNTCIESNPIFAVAYLIHERRTSASHDIFWREMMENLIGDELPASVPICTDREKAITNAIKKRLGDDVKLVYCTNHIKRDAKFWLEKCPGKKPADVCILPKEVDTILQSRSAEEFDENYEYFEKTWSEPFRDYMSANLKVDMKTYASHFYTSTFLAFQNVDATNNAAESFNALVKREVEWKTLRIDSAVLILFNMQLNFLKDFSRAYAETGIGDLVLKKFYKNSRIPFKLPKYAHWDHQQMVDAFKDGLYKPSENVEKEDGFLQSRSAIAKLACSMHYVSLNSQTLIYTVTDPYSGIRHSVEENNHRLKCTCPDSGFCFHKVAYLHVTQKEIIEDKCTWSLSELRKKTRHFKGRSGKKHMNREDFTNVVEAPDSQLAKEKENLGLYIESDTSEDQESIVNVSQSAKSPRKSSSNQQRKHCAPNEEKLSSMGEIHEKDNVDDMLDNYSHHGDFECGVSVSSDGRTPEEFALSSFKKNNNTKLLKSSVYKCLQREEMLMTDVVDDMIALLIKIHGLTERVGFANSFISKKAEMATTNDSIEALLRCVVRIGFLNNDLIIANIRPTSTPHYVLGVIMFNVREIVIVNSTESCPSDPSLTISTLWRLAAASYVAAGFQFDGLGWRIYNENNCAQQTNGFDCGLHVILNALSIVTKQPFLLDQDFPASEVSRAWVFSCLTNKNVQRPISLLKSLGRSRLPVHLKGAMLNEMNESIDCTLRPVERSCSTFIRTQVREMNYDDGTCQSLNCCADADYKGKSIMCVICRLWMHLGLCVSQLAAQDIFYCCDECARYKLV